jgi:hypothetical protein
MAGDDGLEWLSDYLVSALKCPTWVIPIAEYVDDHCSIFDDAEENKFEYTTCHNDFKRLVEDLFIVHLLDVSVSQEQFVGFIQNGLSSKEALHHILCEQLLSVDDFLIFKAMMVRRNAELDRKAALALSAELAGRSLSDGFTLENGAVEAAVSLHHDSGSVGFAMWPMSNDVLAWHDRDFVYSGVPEELVGSTLFAGPHKDMPAGTLIFTTTVSATMYLMCENDGGKRNGGFPDRLKLMPEWVRIGGTEMKWGPCKGKDFWVAIWARKVAAGASIELSMEAPFVGGIAVKADAGDWRLYEEQEQVMKGVSRTGREESAGAVELQTAASLSQEADQKLEQAQLEQAIALSLAAEEERIRQLEIAQAAGVASAQAVPEATVRTPSRPPMEQPAAPAVVPSPEAIEASRHEEPVPDAPASLHAPKELNPVMPRMVRLKPLVGAPAVAALAPSAPSGSSDQSRSDAAQRRERAEQAIEASSSSAAAAAPAQGAHQQPTEEERRLRAEHLKRQRALLMQKRKEERSQQLQAFHASRSAAGVDSALSSQTPGSGGPGDNVWRGNLVNGAGDPNAAVEKVESAQAMRQALTLQLRQSLVTSMPAGQVDQLQQM